jgi:hypothetical protein
MAIMDAKLEFDDAHNISSSIGEFDNSTNVIRLDDLAATMKDAWGTEISPDIGEGNNGLTVSVQIASAFSDSNSFTAKIYNHTTSTVSSGVLMAELVFGLSAAANPTNVAGTKLTYRLPAGNIDNYMGIKYSHVSGANGTGTVDAWLGLDSETPTK